MKMEWFREARFGMFIHWGLYAVPAGVWEGKEVPGIGEWIMEYAKIPVKDYAALAAGFNPTKFDADQWVLAAKNAGMKYIVITTKHHDGFAMFHSKASKYNIFDATPFKRDPMAELAKACKKHGIRLGFYYSQAQDWHHPGGAAWRGQWDPAQAGSMDDYIRDIAVPQVKEILTNYGPISILWWDTPKDMTPERAKPLIEAAALQPDIITNDRLCDGIPGDVTTPEQHIPANGYPNRDWETCMTINDTWGYKSTDHHWKSTETLIRNLIDIASKGGNYLLNVGPTAEGTFPEPIIERLAAMGRWLEVNGEAIYSTTASPFATQLEWGRCTRKGSKLYLHVFDWPADSILRVPIKNEVKKAYALADSKPLECSKSGDAVAVTVPKNASDAIATVIALEIDGEVEAAQ